MGFYNRIKQRIKYDLGITKLEEENKSLLFLFNNCIDITKLPKTKDPDLRILQKCDTVLLAIFEKICEKHNLKYWLSFGSLLGAYRHQGFIPWDDDLDVCMLREEVEQIYPILKNDLESLGFTVKRFNIYPIRGIVLSYKRDMVGVWLDVFSVHTFYSDKDANTIKDDIMSYRERLWKSDLWNYKDILKQRETYLSLATEGLNKYYAPEIETWNGNRAVVLSTPNVIFPLSKIEFEDYSFLAPNNVEEYLTKCYGPNYMQFPRIAYNSHGSFDCVSKRAKNNGINMDEVYHYLLDILKKV